MTKEEALKLALEALDRADKISGYPNNKKAITAIKEALAQPEPSELDIWKVRALQAEAVIEKFMAQPEPVIDKSAAVRIATSLGWEPKRTWVGLADEDLAWCNTEEYKTARYWEAKLKEKNT